jgi:hypothetical protein
MGLGIVRVCLDGVQFPETRLDTAWGVVDVPRESGSSVAQDGMVEMVRFARRVERRESIMVLLQCL